jgi:tRNA pseudouridine38-40 synthase
MKEPEASLQRLRLVVAYDGRPFCGWQSQPTCDSVQDYLENAFSKLIGDRIAVSGAGRTDAGVHAVGQVAHADVPRNRMTTDAWTKALNAHLPHEIRVVKITSTRADFHARFQAIGKIYTYRIWHGPWQHPLEIGRAWHVPGQLDPSVLRDCARILTGRHDYGAFAAKRGNPDLDTVRTIWSIQCHRKQHLITLRFCGDGFLYKMIRLLTGSMVRCAQGRADPHWLECLLAHPRAEKTKYLAPAHGLYLTRVLYGRPPAIV